MVKGDKWMSYSKREVEIHAAEIDLYSVYYILYSVFIWILPYGYYRKGKCYNCCP